MLDMIRYRRKQYEDLADLYRDTLCAAMRMREREAESIAQAIYMWDCATGKAEHPLLQRWQCRDAAAKSWRRAGIQMDAATRIINWAMNLREKVRMLGRDFHSSIAQLRQAVHPDVSAYLHDPSNFPAR